MYFYEGLPKYQETITSDNIVQTETVKKQKISLIQHFQKSIVINKF
jgi:hypothetical protein